MLAASSSPLLFTTSSVPQTLKPRYLLALQTLIPRRSASLYAPPQLRLARRLSVRAAVAIGKENPENEQPETFLRAADDASASAAPTSIGARFERMIREVQDEVCAAIESADGGGRFQEDAWSRPGGGGGISRVLQDGGVWEKAGVNVSVVHGTMPPEAYRAAKGEPRAGGGDSLLNAGPVPFLAAGISSVYSLKSINLSPFLVTLL